jgi:hypothetical protein
MCLERQRRAVVQRCSPKSLPFVSWCTISTDGFSKAFSPKRSCKPVRGWGSLENSATQETQWERERREIESASESLVRSRSVMSLLCVACKEEARDWLNHHAVEDEDTRQTCTLIDTTHLVSAPRNHQNKFQTRTWLTQHLAREAAAKEKDSYSH